MIEADPIPGLFERTRVDAPLSVRERARELATEYVGKVDRLPFAPGDQVGAYEILGVLGAGGQAVVYEARQVALDRRVAIKVPRKDVGDRLTREARLVAKLVHRSVVQVVDLSLDGAVPFLVLELCEKGSLEERLEAVSPDGLPLEQVFSVSVAVLEALAFAHAKGVVHRDVKPANILFDQNDNAKVADFGIGTISVGDELSVSHELSRQSLLAGTPLYLAPEQENPALRTDGAIDGRADLFSFGKVLFQMLTGASPRTIRPASRLRRGLAPSWDEFVFKLTEERPERRFQTPEEALAALPEVRPRPPQPRTAPGTADLALPVVVPGCRILAEHGPSRTATGTSYVAWHERLGRRVVVKVLAPESASNPRTVERFLREARAASALVHPNVLHVLEVGTTRGFHYLVLEHVEGRTLDDLLHDGGHRAWQTAVNLVADVAQALDAAHRAGIVHRDIKAESVIVTPDGQVKLGDFGLAKDLNSDMKLTCDGAMIGTPLYMAPEIGRVKAIDGRVDIYSLGVVFYYLLTGVQPFHGFTAIEILSAKAHDRLAPPETHRALPAAVRRVLGKMLEKDRDHRYQDAAELLADMTALKDGKPVSAGEPRLWAGAARAGGSPTFASVPARPARPYLPAPDRRAQMAPGPGRLFWIVAVLAGIAAGIAAHLLRR